MQFEGSQTKNIAIRNLFKDSKTMANNHAMVSINRVGRYMNKNVNKYLSKKNNPQYENRLFGKTYDKTT